MYVGKKLRHVHDHTAFVRIVSPRILYSKFIIVVAFCMVEKKFSVVVSRFQGMIGRKSSSKRNAVSRHRSQAKRSQIVTFLVLLMHPRPNSIIIMSFHLLITLSFHCQANR